MLTAHDADMPQCGINDVESTQVTFFQPILLAEAAPTLSKKVTNFFICQASDLPCPGAIHCSLEHDCAGPSETNRVAEFSRQRLKCCDLIYFKTDFNHSGRIMNGN